MNLFFAGHQEKYAVEQTLLTLFPQERPVYPDTPPGGDNELVDVYKRQPPKATIKPARRERQTIPASFLIVCSKPHVFAFFL